MAETGAKPFSKEESWLRTIFKTGDFRDDLKRLGKGVYRSAIIEQLPGILERLANDQPLPAALRDHPLSGKYNDSRDLHIRGDLILIYRKTAVPRTKPGRTARPAEKPELHLVRIGSHSELFGK